MKVLYLVPQPKQPNRIGAYTFLDEEIQALAQAGIKAFALSTSAPDDQTVGGVSLRSVESRTSLMNRLGAATLAARRPDGLPLVNVRQPRVWYRAAWLEHVAATIVRDEQIDLIHSHFAWPQGQGGALARAVTGRPLVASLRGTDLVMNAELNYGRRLQPHFDRSVRRMLPLADRTIFFSDHMRRQALALGADPNRTRVIRKGVDLQHSTLRRIGLRFATNSDSRRDR
jgi:glycosyltransferase involved in cell wall biosynthesis